MPGLTWPPFPDDIPTHPLIVIDYKLIQANDQTECDKLWAAATGLGFWYLKNHGAEREVDGMFDMGAETMDLPLEEKMKFHPGDNGPTIGYKFLGSSAADERGTADNVEYMNIAKDDALAFPSVVKSTYPSTVNAEMEHTITPFVRKSLEVNNTFISVFERKLGMPKGGLLKYHPMHELSGSEARVIKSPPRSADILAREPEKISLRAHTDFGTLSFLHNRLGGLQVLPPGSTNWYYVRPIPGHAICNVGDALTIFSGGIIHSNMHRVVPPPGEQASHVRYSIVFFTRPADNVLLNALTDESDEIRTAVEAKNPTERAKYYPNVSAKDWFERRVRKGRLSNWKGPETWREAQGMEHVPAV